MPKQYFVGLTKQGQERLAKRELEKQLFETYLPMCFSEWAKQPRIKPFLVGYIFVRLDPLSERWRAVFSTYGMRSVICSGEHPQPVGDWIIEEIKSREVDGLVRLPPRVLCKFQPGDPVKVKGSPIDAVFDEVVDHRRAAVFLSLLGSTKIRSFIPLNRLMPSSISAVAI